MDCGFVQYEFMVLIREIDPAFSLNSSPVYHGELSRRISASDNDPSQEISVRMSDDSAYAAVPFDHTKADIILRSSDNIDFHIFKLCLSLASPFFETLFDIPQHIEENRDQEIKDRLAVIPVTEDS